MHMERPFTCSNVSDSACVVNCSSPPVLQHINFAIYILSQHPTARILSNENNFRFLAYVGPKSTLALLEGLS